MNRLLLCIVGLCIVATFNCCITPKNNNNESPIYDVEVPEYTIPLTSDIVKAIENIDSLEWIALAVSQEDTFINDSLFYKSHTSDYKTVSDSLSIARFQGILLNPIAYEDEGLTKDCTFVPDVCVRIYSNLNPIDFLFSAYCNECQFITDTITLRLNAENLREPLRKQYRLIIPKKDIR